MKRGEIYWANLDPPVGRRPVLIATPDEALKSLPEITVVPITRRFRGTPAEVEVGTPEGMRVPSAANCHAIRTIPLSAIDREPIGRLDPSRTVEFDAALCFALGIDVIIPTR